MKATRRPAPELPGFSLVDRLGGGGFADVFRYSQDGLGRDVAIKVAHLRTSDKALASFHSEASLMAQLSNHPNIVSIFQAGIAEDGRAFIVMEMCPSLHLGERIARRLFGPAKAMEIGVQIAGAVETAHRLGILHRDIKPANILFTEFGRPALTDFGISVSLRQDGGTEGAMSPKWAPPEQFGNFGGALGPWSDVYSLAATLWAMLVGRSPMHVPGEPNDLLHLNTRVRTMPAPRTGRAEVPEELERVLAVALAKNPRERYQSALEFARALQAVQAMQNQAVTPIDVLSNEPDLAEAEEELQGEGTRVSGFRLIDPEPTSSASGLSGGITSPGEGPRNPSMDGLALQFVSHGRGVSVSGVRDFTGPGIPMVPPQPEEPAQPGSAPAGPKKGLPAKTLAVVAVFAIVAAAIVVFQVLKRDIPGTTEPATQAPSRNVPPADPLEESVPLVTGLAGKRSGGRVTFTWKNPDAKEGDSFRYQVMYRNTEQEAAEITKETTVEVPAQLGGTCIEVRLVRANGALSEPAKKCV